MRPVAHLDPPFATLTSKNLTSQMVGEYWMALVSDVPFSRAIDGGRGRHRIFEDLLSVREHKVAGDQHGAQFVAFDDKGEQHLGFLGILFDVSNIVEDQKTRKNRTAQPLGQLKGPIGAMNENIDLPGISNTSTRG